MKTLDEVIAELEDEGLFADALQWLKMYRSDMQIYAENQKHWEDELMRKIKDFGDAKERYIKRLKELNIGTLNEPLSWDELKQMEGKPVWYEVLDPKALPALDQAGWGLVGRGTFTTWRGVESFSLIRIGVTYALPTSGYGKTWQAYRKER